MASTDAVAFALDAPSGKFSLVPSKIPEPQPNEIVVKTSAIAFNPLDLLQYAAGLFISSWPAVFGIEGAGTVVAVGSNVPASLFAPGDRICAKYGGSVPQGERGSRVAAFQSYAAIPMHMAAKVPAGLTDEEAASLPVGFATAMNAPQVLDIPLTFAGEKAEGKQNPKSILVLGGSGAVGASVIQLLRLCLGADLKIFATSSPAHHQRLLDLGADKAFDRKSATLAADVKAASPGAKGVDMIVDGVGAAGSDQTVFDALSPEGPMSYGAVVMGKQYTVPSGVTRSNYGLGEYIATEIGQKSGMGVLTGLLAEGKYKVPLPTRHMGHGWEAIATALEEYKAGRVSGEKLVITV